MTEKHRNLKVTYTHEEDLLPPVQRAPLEEWSSWGIWALLLALIVLATFVPMLGGKVEPIFQDDLNLGQNPFMLTARGWWAIWRFPHQAFQQFSPLGYSLFWIEFQLPRTFSDWFRMNSPFEYLRLTHFVSIFLHLGNAMLLWTILRKLEIRGAWLAAAIFAIHPLQVQSVAWMSQQPLILGTFLGLLSLILYLRYCGVNPKPVESLTYFKLPETRWVLYALSLLLLILAVLAKPWLAIIPGVMLILIWWERGSVKTSDLKQLAPFLFITLAAIAGSIFILARDPGRATNFEGLSTIGHMAAAGRAMWTYVWMLLLPYPLAFAYPKWSVEKLGALQLMFLLAAIGAIIFLYSLRKRFGRAVFASGLLMILAVLPAVVYFNETNLRGAFVADASAYLAVAVFAVAIASLLSSRFSPAVFKPQHPSNIVTFVAIICVMSFSIVHSFVYQKPLKLWQHSIDRYDNAYFARVELAQLKLEVRDTEAAATQFREVLRAEPDNRRALFGYAGILQSRADHEKALGAYLLILRKNPNDVEAKLQSALCYLNMGDSVRAAEITNKILSDDPKNVSAYLNLSVIAQARGEYDAAMKYLNTAIEIAPNETGPRLNRATLYYNAGNLEAAEQDITKLVEMHPNSFEAWFNAASMCASMAQFVQQAELQQGVSAEEAQKHATLVYERAEVFYRTALGIRPDSAIAHANLGKLMLILGKFDAAAFSFKQACALDANNLDYENYRQQAEEKAKGNLTKTQ